MDRLKKECPRALTNLVGEYENNLGILQKLGENTKGWSSLLVHMITLRLDQTTLRGWQRTADKKRMPTYDELIQFLRDYIGELETLRTDRNILESRSVPQNINTTTSYPSKEQCLACGRGHQLYYCESFKHMPLSQRISIVSKAGLCNNCLFGKHSPTSCKYGSCRECGAKHHTLLHNSAQNSPSTSYNRRQQTNDSTVSHITQSNSLLLSANKCNFQSNESLSNFKASDSHIVSRFDHSPPSQVFLATAVVKVLGSNGNSFLARALLDNASQPNLMTERFRRFLNIRKTPENTEIAGVGGDIAAVSNYSAVATVASRFNNYRVPLEFIVMEKVTNDLPTCTVDTSDWVIPENVRLADPSFAIKGPIDIVIGAQVFFDLIRNGHFKIAHDKPVLQNSVLGWLVSGLHLRRNPVQNHYSCQVSMYQDLDQRVNKFWELESCSSNVAWSVEEKRCEDNFIANTRRDSSGRYIVSLPKKEELIGQLGNSLSIAILRFYSLEKRFELNKELRHQYTQFMKEYLDLGHMKLVEPVEDIPGHHFYLPHHAVLKPDSTTTKLRVVFDGSCKTTSGFSLNDLLLTGPTVQDNMIFIILRFRMKRIVVTADITKMYRQIWVHEKDQMLQRILWRDSPSEPLRTYQLTTITYGTTSAPYLATRCLQKLADDEADNFPAAVPVVKKGFYVDDLMYGFDSLEEAEAAVRETSQMLEAAGFPLRKWASNRIEILELFPSDQHEQSPILELDHTAPIKTLGLLWKPISDELHFRIPEGPDKLVSTKRNILSYVCSMFDPLGLVGPVICSAKLLIQTLWERKFG
ncbi:uncharacterized protein LOC129766692 [Toxorhynchites rutilus septentrionalis]|uniref:uncharacterized protein LOC129766692 n=1 Tax=Toxorhynchites rutilus septentrionalis TaxID=329112 RepID=UPI00247855D4|nr:uncharacterized protein LOC129766692 [Toxorhynchites rutilus septentrionalis]